MTDVEAATMAARTEIERLTAALDALKAENDRINRDLVYYRAQIARARKCLIIAEGDACGD